MTDEQIRQLLTESKVIAVVGHSDRPARTSYQIARFLRNIGYRVYAVNPTVDTIDGEPSYARVQDIPEQVDIVDVFRRSEHLPEIVDDAIAAGAKAVWGQLSVINRIAREKAESADMQIIMDRCIKVEYMRLI